MTDPCHKEDSQIDKALGEDWPVKGRTAFRHPWVASEQYGMRFILSRDNKIILRADEIPIETLRAMVDAANKSAP